MPIATQCPKCQAAFSLADSLAGKKVKCGRCQNVFTAPDATPTAELVDVPGDAPTAAWVDPPAGVAAKPMRPPPRPTPPQDRYPSARRDPDEPPRRRSGSGVGWIVALAVGIPLLLLLLVGGGIVAVGFFVFMSVQSTSSGPVSVSAAGPAMAQDGGGDGPPGGWNQPPPGFPGDAPAKPREMPPALKAAAGIDVTPANLAQEKVVRRLPTTVADAAVGGGGRFLILYLPQQNKLAVFDVSAAQVVKYLSFTEPNLKFAAGMDKLIVALPNSRVLRRYSLKTFETEQTAPLPINGTVEAMCMGSASNGPLWIQANNFANTTAMLVDPSTLKEWPADWGPDKKQPVGLNLRASEDGQTFALREGGGEPHTETVVAIHGGQPQADTQWGVSSSLVIPDADGRTLYAGDAVYTAGLKPIYPNPPPQQFAKSFLPAVGGPYFVRLDYTQWGQPGGDLALFLAGMQEPFAFLKDLESVMDELDGGKLACDRRIFVLPAAKIVVTIPPTDDRLVLYRFDPEAALEKSNVDYLVVTSRPPTSAKKGQPYVYQLAAKSRKGGVKYKLDSGPNGMAIDAAGKLTWTPPADAEAANDVIVSVTDAGGQETQHSFRVGAE